MPRVSQADTEVTSGDALPRYAPSARNRARQRHRFRARSHALERLLREGLAARGRRDGDERDRLRINEHDALNAEVEDRTALPGGHGNVAICITVPECAMHGSDADVQFRQASICGLSMTLARTPRHRRFSGARDLIPNAGVQKSGRHHVDAVAFAVARTTRSMLTKRRLGTWAASKSTRTSTSLSGPKSSRSTEPNNASRLT